MVVVYTGLVVVLRVVVVVLYVVTVVLRVVVVVLRVVAVVLYVVVVLAEVPVFDTVVEGEALCSPLFLVVVVRCGAVTSMCEAVVRTLPLVPLTDGFVVIRVVPAAAVDAAADVVLISAAVVSAAFVVVVSVYVVTSAVSVMIAAVVSMAVDTVAAVTLYGPSSGWGDTDLNGSMRQIPKPTRAIRQQLRAMAVRLINIAFLRFFSSKYSSLRRKTRSAI